MKLVIFGLAVTSSWGNGHATTFRSLCRALAARGHKIVFYERDAHWYRDNRDLPHPEFCQLRLYDDWKKTLPQVRRDLRDADVAMVGSYFPDGIAANQEMLDAARPVKTFYDIDTPITVAALRMQGATEYLLAEQLRDFDIYFSFTGGPMLREIGARYGPRRALPLYCSFDPERYRRVPPRAKFTCDLSYMGTYAPDRQPKLEELLHGPARRLPHQRFIVAGPQYPRQVKWAPNVKRMNHLNPQWHPEFYSSARITLNVTRREMVHAGYSPSVRLFEAAACGAAIASDTWAGLDTFFTPGEEVLLPNSADDVARYITGYDDADLLRIGERAQWRVLSAHTSEHRALEFEAAIAAVHARHKDAVAS
ncbi:MAG: glycosyltransferase [Candidatus Koribacter versatilis]|uniref:Glycosyltransferase n=1 Tax=Candidatus Korobacter versatilis TaxID=658062 RepID=A0A932A8A4_9BACT|nr:glycosyltransferase [Candidatus Koribacter versatilis]